MCNGKTNICKFFFYLSLSSFCIVSNQGEYQIKVVGDGLDWDKRILMAIPHLTLNYQIF